MLSGPSSAGKSSLAKALQRRLPGPCVLIEADRAFPSVPTSHPAWTTTGHSHADVVLAFHRSIVAWAEHGFALIVDGSLPYGDHQLRDACLRQFDAFDLRLVGVRCSLPELSRREEQRPEDRLIGWAARQAKDVHDGLHLAADVDTTDRSPDECAQDVVAQLGFALIP